MNIEHEQVYIESRLGDEESRICVRHRARMARNGCATYRIADRRHQRYSLQSTGTRRSTGGIDFHLFVFLFLNRNQRVLMFLFFLDLQWTMEEDHVAVVLPKMSAVNSKWAWTIKISLFQSDCKGNNARG